MVDCDFWAVLMAERKAGWDALRGLGPVVEKDGVYHLTRRDDVLAALRNPEVFSSARRLRRWGFDVIDWPRIPTGLDPPEHTRYRKILQPFFSHTAVKELEPTLAEYARALVDAVAADGKCDAITDVAAPYAAVGLQKFCGLPPEDIYRMAWWKHDIQTGEPGSGRYLTAVFEMFGYLASAITQRRENPGCPGLLGGLPAVLSDTEATAASFMVIGGGVGNETAAIGYALLALATDPELRCVLRADPLQVGVFVEEILRLEPPVAMWGRVCTQEVTIGDVTIPAGSAVALHMGAVNREDSNSISVADGQITRHRHWSFGAGPHRCPAVHLARTELTVLLTEWLHRIPEFEIEPGYSPAIHENVFHSEDWGAMVSFTLTSLPLRW